MAGLRLVFAEAFCARKSPIASIAHARSCATAANGRRQKVARQRFSRAMPEGFDRTIYGFRGTCATFLAIKGLADQEWPESPDGSHKLHRTQRRICREARVIISLSDSLSA